MILVLGGTAEARALATALLEAGVRVTTSLAGRVARPRLPPGEVRIGGFGGSEAMTAWLRDHGATAVVDASHPFAQRISASAASACSAAGVSLLRLERPGWTERAGDRWTWVSDLEAAAAIVPQLGERVFLTTGRQGLSAFAGIETSWFLVRCVDPPEPPLPPHHQLILDRGPYTLDGERELIERHQIGLLVTKDSGGSLTEAKLDAARERGLPVVVVQRPPRGAGETVTRVEDALAWALRHVHSG